MEREQTTIRLPIELKEALQKQLNLLLERSQLCNNEVLAPITEQIINISKILMDYDVLQ